jgi:CrcB protein
MGFLIVFIGAGIGGAMRHGVNLAAYRMPGGPSFPYGTLAINVLGSFAMGLAAGYFALRSGLPQHVRLFLATGVLGGFTTFSTFSLDVALLCERGQAAQGIGYAAGSVVLSVGALFLALALVRWGLSGSGT